ncbi:MAG: uroporphyrinogen-III C-methyltransferase, partial [Alphaproteobacteria bacterium]
LLPSGLGGWAAAAKKARRWLQAMLPDAARRRRFWEKFADRAMAAPPPPDPDAALQAMARERPMDRTALGRVTLVGAGPGDAGLLTLKAMRALQAADVILFDDLVSADVLDLARREAKRMLVGKRGGRCSCRQDDIHALMLKLARQGRHVVRLKSGDPMIFGRAGEEIAMLRAAGVAVDVVPGITAAAGAAAALGVSLTHRDRARSVRFVTGHGRDGDLPADLDWSGLADPATTLIVYMGGRTAAGLAGRLLAAGMPRHTPAVAMSNISRPDQRVQPLSLAALAEDGIAASGEPVLIGIGAVFRDAVVDDRAARVPLAQGGGKPPMAAPHRIAGR